MTHWHRTKMRCPANKTFQIQEKFTFSTLHSSYIRRVARRLVRTLGLHCIALHCIALHCIVKPTWLFAWVLSPVRTLAVWTSFSKAVKTNMIWIRLKRLSSSFCSCACFVYIGSTDRHFNWIIYCLKRKMYTDRN
jgi:hypothetical protein